MELIYITILGAIQGATEFLPVSSSGHLAVGKMLFNLQAFANQPLLLEIVLHLATLMAVIIIYRKDVIALVKGAGSIISSLLTMSLFDIISRNSNARLLALIFVGSLPTAIIGITLEKTGIAGEVAQSHFYLGISFLVCAGILLLGRFEKKDKRPVSFKMAFIIGLAQGIAVMPGISRSGTTIVIALLLGMERAEAAKFSFLLSIPAILGAAVLDLNLDAFANSSQILAVSLGFVVAFMVGLLALMTLIKLVKSGRLWLFAPYVAAVGVSVIVFL